MSQIGIAVGVPFGGRLLHHKWVLAFKTVDMPVNTTHTIITVTGSPVTDARNQIAKTAIDNNCKYLFFLDDDVVIPRTAVMGLGSILDKGSESGVMVSTGIYCTKTYAPAPVIYRDDTPGAFWDWRVNEIFDVDSCGAGCMMIDTRVFEHLEYPYFRDIQEYREVNGEQVLHAVSEDIYFCRSVKAAGFRIQAHGAIVCPHYDNKTDKFYQLPEDSLPVTREVARQKAEMEAQQESEQVKV